MELKKIASFQVDHTKLERGMYVSRVDGDVTTYDIRFKRPNQGDYFTTGTAHTLEHLFATYARSSKLSDQVIYVGPMGCRTGFYLLCRGMGHEEAIGLARDALEFISAYEGDIPGATEAECGNYLDQDLPGARAEAAEMARVLAGWTPDRLAY